MKKKILMLFIAAAVGLGLHKEPKAAEREVIEVDWDLTFYDEEEVKDEPTYDKALLAKVCMGEAGTEPMVGKVAVIATILNRCDAYSKTVAEVVYAPNQYYTGYCGEISEEALQAVEIAIAQRDLFPSDMFYFRTNHYHNFGEPYVPIGSHYFSRQGD